MSDTTLPANEASEPLAATEGTPTALEIPEALEIAETIVEIPEQSEVPLEAEIEEELIIEDFTIDGICGVY